MKKNNYYFGLSILVINTICLWGLIVSAGWFAWLSLISTVMSIYGLRYSPRWFYIICLSFSVVLFLYLIYGIIAAF